MPVQDYELLDTTGYTSTVFLIPGTRKVCKSFFPSCTDTNFQAEKEAYERFSARGHPPTILKYYGVEEPASVILELAEYGRLDKYLWDSKYNFAFNQRKPPSQDDLYRWARQAAEALSFAHSCGVLHSDIHCVNFLLDEELNLKVADWAGASIDGSKSWSFYRRTHQLLDVKGTTIASEIFGLGSALYWMVSGHDLFPELDGDHEKEGIRHRFQEKKFPDTSELLVLRTVIMKCWNLEYSSMAEVIEGIDTEIRQGARVG